MRYLEESSSSRRGECQDRGRGRVMQGQGFGNGEFLLNGNRVSVWEDVKVLEVDGCGGKIYVT